MLWKTVNSSLPSPPLMVVAWLTPLDSQPRVIASVREHVVGRDAGDQRPLSNRRTRPSGTPGRPGRGRCPGRG